MIRDVVDQNDPITVEDVEDFARRHRLELPASYWAFLLRNNGGQPIPPFFPIVGFPDNPLGKSKRSSGSGRRYPLKTWMPLWLNSATYCLRVFCPSRARVWATTCAWTLAVPPALCCFGIGRSV